MIKPSVFLSPGLLLCLALAAVVFWGTALCESLWLDEGVTYFVVKDGFKDTLYRAIKYQPYSPLYYVLVWPFVNIGGSSEIALRIPSLLCFFGLCAVVHSFARDLEGDWGAALTVLALVCVNGLLGYAFSARPYAVSMLLAVSATYAFYRWIENGARYLRGLYVVLAVLTVYSHCLYSGILFVHFIYFFACHGLKACDRHLSVRELMGVFFLICILISPMGYILSGVMNKSGALSFSRLPSLWDLVLALARPYVLVSMAAAVVCTHIIFRRIEFKSPGISRPLLLLFVLWYVAPIVGSYLFSVIGKCSIFFPRYYSLSLPALAFLLGQAFSSILCQSSRFYCGVITCGLMFVYVVQRSPFVEDWASASSFVQERVHEENQPVLAYTGLVESQDSRWILDEEGRKYLLAPLCFYAAALSPVVLPASFDQPGANEYLEGEVFPLLSSKQGFYLIVRRTYVSVNGQLEFSDDYYAKRFELRGFGKTREEEFGQVRVLVFEKKERSDGG